MKDAFLSGFVKEAVDAGYSDDQISSLWKSAMEHSSTQEWVNTFPAMEKDALTADDLELLSGIKTMLDKQAEVAQLKAYLAQL